MKILAVDLGLARTGIAISDVNQILASPFCVIAEKNKEILLQKIHDKLLHRRPYASLF